MKNFIIIASFLLISSLAISQTASDKVQAAFSEEKITELKENDPNQLEYWNFFADEVFVYNADAKNWQQFDDISTIEPKFEDVPVLSADNFDPETFNPLLYDIELKDKELQFFKLGDTGKVVMIYSNMRFDVLFERYMINKQ